jgi:hypothetical protein
MSDSMNFHVHAPAENIYVPLVEASLALANFSFGPLCSSSTVRILMRPLLFDKLFLIRLKYFGV